MSHNHAMGQANAMCLANLSPMPGDETAALLFLCGDQYLFRYRNKDGSIAYKFVSTASVRAAFAEEPLEIHWLPSNVRRWGIGKRGEWIVVSFPPQKHRFSFVTEDDERKNVTLELPMPALAFFGYEQRYHLWAFTDAELKGDTTLGAAPLPNVDANGAICFGSNLVPKASAKTIEEAWRIFVASPFTNHSVNDKSRQYPIPGSFEWLALKYWRWSQVRHCQNLSRNFPPRPDTAPVSPLIKTFHLDH